MIIISKHTCQITKGERSSQFYSAILYNMMNGKTATKKYKYIFFNIKY